ncbi:MAG: isopentenyl-diphosphate Delta-isomerase [Bacteroidales bacterium]|nr:isopentenyl-diphosphate Delta-isomerase [Bacteroidales bacterium]MDZ4203173.1 isopentenyl-diphosphate Delta-isomerase [Bacteroidales bacterium]
MEKVILVDSNDKPFGTEEKIRAHELALLHRAFSVFVFNHKGEMMLQRRSLNKYHSPGLWSNSCCSHPRPGKDTLAEAHRRLIEEMGFDCDLQWKLSFIYKAPFDNGLTEHEFDHVFFGTYDEDPVLNPGEVAEWKWIGMEDLMSEVIKNPQDFTVWFKIALEEITQDGLNI